MGKPISTGLSRRKLLRRTVGMTTAAMAIGVTTLAAPPPVAAQEPVETGFINGQVKLNGTTMSYVVYVPRGYTPDKQWPVILFLHGAYGDGKDVFVPMFGTIPLKKEAPVPPSNTLPLKGPSGYIWGGSLGTAVIRNPQRFPCLIVWPQIPPGNATGPWSGRYEAVALQALEQVVGKYNGDRTRLYVTGISLGGIATWNFVTDHPELFAAAIPISGCGDYPIKKIVEAVQALPMWVFHGDKDSVIPVNCSRRLVAAVLATGNPNLHYTEYPGVDHNCWDIAYNDPQVIAWLLSQHR